MLKNLSDFEGLDAIYTAMLVPIFFFILAYIVSRWIMHFTVCSVNRKGIRILFSVEVIMICFYVVVLLFFLIIKYSGLWLEYRFLQFCYARILVLFASAKYIMICVFLGTLFALAVRGRELERGMK